MTPIPREPQEAGSIFYLNSITGAVANPLRPNSLCTCDGVGILGRNDLARRDETMKKGPRLHKGMTHPGQLVNWVDII
jgi:hypothetical protein